MEIAKKEVEMIEALVNNIPEGQLKELNDLQLLMIGGGCADPIFA